MHVEIWSDIACPWCYVGKRRFEAALEGFEHRDAVTVTYRSFELDPHAPREREGDLTTLLARKYGITVEDARAAQDRLTELGAAENLTFDFARARSGSTFDAHRLVHLAAAHGCQDTMKERLMRAYFSEGALMSDPATLAACAADVGLAAAEVDDLIAGDRFTDEVRDDELTAARVGINAVPFYVIDRRLGLAGAQSPEVMLEGLQRGWATRSTAPA